MTVNHGVPGSSPGEGAKRENESFPFFLFTAGREVYPERSRRKPGEGANKKPHRNVVFFLLFRVCNVS